MNTVLQQISDIGILPVIKLDRVSDAVPLAKALMEGGLPCAEITFRTQAAEESIRAISKELPQMLVGAGTVLTSKQADVAIAAGAAFLVSPGLNPKVVEHCIKKNYPIVPGVSNPSDIEAAMSLGLDAVKFFPAEAAGGLKMIKAMSAPYVNMQFMPTGGINESNLTEYLDFNKVIACGGSWMVDSNMLDSGNFEGIKKLTQNAVNKMLGFKLAHIGINSRDEASALATAQLFQRSFGYAENSGDSSIFMGSEIEIMKHMGRGKTGHIALKTNYIKRAMRYLGSNGIMCDEQSRVYDEKGNLKLIYLAADFGGFSVHLSQK